MCARTSIYVYNPEFITLDKWIKALSLNTWFEFRIFVYTAIYFWLCYKYTHTHINTHARRHARRKKKYLYRNARKTNLFLKSCVFVFCCLFCSIYATATATATSKQHTAVWVCFVIEYPFPISIPMIRTWVLECRASLYFSLSWCCR